MILPIHHDDPRYPKSGAVYLPAGEGPTTWFSGDVYTIKASPASWKSLDGARRFTARTGDFIFVPRDIRHRFKNTSLHATKLLFMFTPGGEEGVFAHGDEPQPGRLPAPWPPERFVTPELLKFSEEYAIEILPETD